MSQADIKLSKVGVIMLGVRDLKKSVAFYRDVLGLTASGMIESFAFFSAGGVTLALRQVEGLGEEGDERRTEVVFAVDDVQAAHQSLKARGVKFRVEPRPVTGDQYAADFRDPDNHVLSIFGPSSSSPRF
jgi:catechol 2,3-dioxygenase-like lactoylglutathione lyase family enzyme